MAFNPIEWRHILFLLYLDIQRIAWWYYLVKFILSDVALTVLFDVDRAN